MRCLHGLYNLKPANLKHWVNSSIRKTRLGLLKNAAGRGSQLGGTVSVTCSHSKKKWGGKKAERKHVLPWGPYIFGHCDDGTVRPPPLHDAANLTLKWLLVGTNSFLYIDVRFSRATVRVALLRLSVGQKTRRPLFLSTFQEQHLCRVFIASFDVSHGFSNTRDWSRLVHSLSC